jgi:hypothetical protein
MGVSALIGLVVTWLGIILAYDSDGWPPVGHGWPVSFFVVVLVLAAYLLSSLWPRRPRAAGGPAAAAAELAPGRQPGPGSWPAGEGVSRCSPR